MHGESTFEQFLAHYEEYTDVVGDHFLNLAATTLPTNAYLLAGEPKYKRWIVDYMDAWLDRMRENGGIIPSFVDLDGTIGGAEGKWWAGAYGWGFSPVNPVTGRREDRNRIGWALVGFGNALLVTGDQKYVDAWRTMIDGGECARARRAAAASSIRRCTARTAGTAGATRRGTSARWKSGTGRRSPRISARAGPGRCRPAAAPTRRSAPRDGSAFFAARTPTYPEQALEWDLDLIDKRLTAMRRDTTPPERRLADNMLDYNPAATESLVQLMWGALMPGRNGGLLNARLRYFDPDRQRAGVPEDVAALVSELSDTRTTVTLVNLNPIAGATRHRAGRRLRRAPDRERQPRRHDHADSGAALHRAARSRLRRDAGADHEAIREHADGAPSVAPAVTDRRPSPDHLVRSAFCV